MCSCDTSSGRTVSAQRQAAFSSCRRGAMALAGGAPPEPGRRCCLRSRPNGLRHLPAMRTRRSLSQLASQSPVRATAAAPARARPARPAAKRRRRHPTPHPPPHPRRRWRWTPRRAGRMRAPGGLCAARGFLRAGERREGQGRGAGAGAAVPRPHRCCRGSSVSAPGLRAALAPGPPARPLAPLRLLLHREGVTREATQRTYIYR